MADETQKPTPERAAGETPSDLPVTFSTFLLGLSTQALQQFEIKLMQPVLPMLAQPAEDVAAALKDLGRAIGTDVEGKVTTVLRIVIEADGSVVTAFPIR